MHPTRHKYPVNRHSCSDYNASYWLFMNFECSRPKEPPLKIVISGLQFAHTFYLSNLNYCFSLLLFLVPDTRSSPDERAFKQTTLFPLNLPATRIRTVPVE